ncbi:MAG: transcription antitermination factor NusB [Gammaproteobacteria bacterium]
MTTSSKRGPNIRHRARRAAVQALYEWQLTANEPESVVDELIASGGQGRLDEKYLRELVLGTVNAVNKLDDALKPHLDREIADVDPVERAVLRLGAYELVHRIEVPLRVVINEGVELAKTFGAEDGHKYVNGVLDKLARTVRPEAKLDTRPRSAKR